MFQRIITFSVGNPLIISLGVIGLIIWGIRGYQHLPIDAVPDITNNQVQIVTLSPSLSPQEVERLITVPVEQTMATIAGIVERRSISRFGLSVITLVFEDDVDLYWARAQVDQRLVDAQSTIPAGMGSPTIMPITTGLGEIYQYTIEADSSHSYSPMELRTIHDWIIKRGLLGTKGVADVASFGGFLKQLEIAVDPDLLAAQGLSVADVLDRVAANNGNSGGAYIERGQRLAFIRTEGLVTSAEDVENIVLKTNEHGIPLLVSDVAQVHNGHAVRYGALTHGDSSEAVGGIVYMLKGANSSQVVNDVRQRIKEIEKTLPPGISVVPFLDRSELVNRTINTVATNLAEGALIVVFVLVLMLGNMRAGLIVASVIPLSMLFAVGMMQAFGVSGNLMSLGAIDFGLIVDGTVIIVEHVLSALARNRWSNSSERIAIVQHAALDIRRSASFGEGIILIVYLPILALSGIEGKMFIPMAQTIMFAIAGAFILSNTYVPMIAARLLTQPQTGNTIADRIVKVIYALYAPIRRFALRRGFIVITSSVALVAAMVIAISNIGGEFIPTLEEGDFAVETRLPTGSTLTQTIEVAHRAAHILESTFPEVNGVVGKIGTSEIPMDPMPIESGDLMVLLKPISQWTTAHNREELADSMQRALAAIPGVEFGFQQPIQMRFNELMTGARQDVVVKIYGDDLAVLAQLAERTGEIAEHIHGATDVYVEPIAGLPQVVAAINREACAVFGVSVSDVNSTVQTAFAGTAAGPFFDGDKRFDVVVRLNPENRKHITDLQQLMVNTSSGKLVPLTQVANVEYRDGPNQIQREHGRRRITVGFNVRNRDVESIVSELQQNMKSVTLPVGYEVSYGGQFENLANATSRLTVVVPAALLLIMILLYITFGSLTDTLLVFTAIPLSAVGGTAALMLRGMPFSISAGIGFIALFGVAVLNGIVLMASFRKHRITERRSSLSAVMRGTTERLRPVTTTALVASLGFLPMAISTSAGAEVQRPLATVVIGGLLTSTFLTLVVLPVMYHLVHKKQQHDDRTSH